MNERHPHARSTGSHKLFGLVLCSMGCGSPAARVEIALPLPPSRVEAVAVANDRDPPFGPSERFRLRVEQDGSPKRIESHAVTLAKRPFTLVFELHGVELIAVNASYSPATFDLARSRAPFSRLHAFGPARGLAEEAENPSRLIFVDDEGFNYWGWDKTTHRCHVHEVRAGTTLCKRVVETFGVSTRIESSSATSLYLVVVATADSENGEGPDDDDREVELQRDWLQITFR